MSYPVLHTNRERERERERERGEERIIIKRRKERKKYTFYNSHNSVKQYHPLTMFSLNKIVTNAKLFG